MINKKKKSLPKRRLVDHKVKIKENEMRDKYLDPARELKKVIEHKSDDDTNYNWCTKNGPHRVGKETEKVRNKRTKQNRPNYSITKISQNTEKNSGDLRRLAFT